MLEMMRRNSRNLVIYVLFGVIIAVFVINFGPGSRGCSPGGGTITYAARVGNYTVNEQDFRFAYIALTRGQVSQAAQERRIKEFVMGRIIERELMAQEAERLGFRVSAAEAEDLIRDGRMMTMGITRRLDDYVFKNGAFDYDRFKMVAQNQLGVSVVRFIDIERRELLAERLRELMRNGVKVSLDDVKSDFEQKGRQVNLEYVRFSPSRYEDQIDVTPAELDAYVKSHEAELKKQYEERAFLYKKVGKQVRVRHILVAVDKDATAAAVAAARTSIEQAAAKVKAGTAFSEVAKAVSSDEHSKGKGGLLPWSRQGATRLGESVEAAVFAAKPGALVGPLKTNRGFELVEVVGFREGEVSAAEAERELAETAVASERAKAKAKWEAEALAARLHKGEKLEAAVPKSAAAKSGEAGDDESSLAASSESGPQLRETGLFPQRGETVQSIGLSKELSRRAFELKVGEVAGPFELAGGSGYVLVRLKERKEPDKADFEKRKQELVSEYQRTKWAEVAQDWSQERCEAVRNDGRIQVNEDILSEGEGASANGPKYRPCTTGRF